MTNILKQLNRFPKNIISEKDGYWTPSRIKNKIGQRVGEPSYSTNGQHAE